MVRSSEETGMMLCYRIFARCGNQEDKTPNAKTLEAMQELENGGGIVFKGSTHDFISTMPED